jgi:type VI secretion system secreted protein Hcp
VAHPLAGMMIYSKNTKAPFFHDGNKWLSLGGRFPAPPQTTAGGNITYQIIGPGFNGAELPVYSAQVGMGFGVSQPGPPSPSSASEFVFTKQLDANSMGFQLATLQGTLYADIEFKFYATGSAVPYISYKFKNVYLTGYSASSGGDTPSESVSVNYKNYGFKDWVNNVSFGYDIVTHAVTSY